MGRTIIVGVALVALCVAGYYLLRSDPAFDLDEFATMVTRLKAGHKVSSRVADTDAIPEYLKVERAYLDSLSGLLTENMDDCDQAVQVLENRYAEFQAKLDELPDRMTPEKLATLPLAQQQREAHKIIFMLAPAYVALRPPIEEWAWECKQESQVLEKVLGTMARSQ